MCQILGSDAATSPAQPRGARHTPTFADTKEQEHDTTRPAEVPGDGRAATISVLPKLLPLRTSADAQMEGCIALGIAIQRLLEQKIFDTIEDESPVLVA